MSKNLMRLATRRLHGLAKRHMRRMQRVAQVWRDARVAAAESGRSTARILQDVIVLRTVHSFQAEAYFRYRLFEPGLTREAKLRYISDKQMRAGLWSLLTPRRYRALYDNKLVFHRFFGSLGFPLPELYGTYDPAVGHTLDGRSLKTAAELREWLRSFAGDGFVFKPAEGGQGHQVLVFASRAADDPAVFLTLAGERYDAERLVAFTRQTAGLEQRDPDAHRYAYLLQERLRPHPAIAALTQGSTLCTVRVQTFIGLDGRPRLLAAAFKIQTGPVGTDNFHVRGTIGCWIHPETGVLGTGRTRWDFAYTTAVIPGTERFLAGFQLPQWAEAKDLALRAAAAFPWARAIGWDIALTDRGPVLLEGNDTWGTSVIQTTAPHGLMTGEFKTLCDALGSSRGA